MKKLFLIFVLPLLLLAGCGGGGGGGGTFTLTGAVEWISTGGSPSPAATVQVGGDSVGTAADGSFVLTVPAGSSSALVIYTPTGGSPISTRFDFSPLTSNMDLGTLVIGPESISVKGFVKSGSTGAAVPNALVSFAGRTALTDASGAYTLTNVAYDSAKVANFLNIEGTVIANQFLVAHFHPTNAAVSSTATVDDILLVPVSGSEPPGIPATISGTVTPAASATGTTLTLLSGSTPVRQVVLDSTSNVYRFWIGPGTYTLRASNSTNGKSAPDAPVTVSSTEDSITKNVTLQ